MPYAMEYTGTHNYHKLTNKSVRIHIYKYLHVNVFLDTTAHVCRYAYGALEFMYIGMYA